MQGYDGSADVAMVFLADQFSRQRMLFFIRVRKWQAFQVLKSKLRTVFGRSGGGFSREAVEGITKSEIDEMLSDLRLISGRRRNGRGRGPSAQSCIETFLELKRR